MISRDARPLRCIQNGRRTALIHDIIPRVSQIHSLLLPQEKNTESRHERCELVGDVLQHFRILVERAQEGGVGFEGLVGEGEGGELLEAAEEVRFAGAEVGGAEEEDAVGAGVDGVQVGDLGRGAGGGVGEGSLDDDAAEGMAEEDYGPRLRVLEL